MQRKAALCELRHKDSAVVPGAQENEALQRQLEGLAGPTPLEAARDALQVAREDRDALRRHIDSSQVPKNGSAACRQFQERIERRMKGGYKCEHGAQHRNRRLAIIRQPCSNPT